jgi:integrase
MKHRFVSGFAGQIQGMLDQRASMGHSIDSYNCFFMNFDRFCAENFPDETTLTKEIAFAWCNEAKGNGKGGANRAGAIRGLARHILSSGGTAYVIPPSFFPSPRSKAPMIMNDAELANFFAAADRYPANSRYALYEFTVPAIFRLQYACGMRPQEARRLRCVDFNYAGGTIYIHEGKHHKDRCLPVSPDVMGMCRKYNQIAEGLAPNRTFFFQALSGNMHSKEWLRDAFRTCWDMSGNAAGRGSCTPYMLRHNFATRTLMRWAEEGKDLDSMVPYLSAYMGHATFSATYYYIHLLPERLALMDFISTDGIIPEAAVYDEE